MNTIQRIAFPIGILVVGVVSMSVLTSQGTAAKKESTMAAPLDVTVSQVTASSHQAHIEGTGTVRSPQNVRITPSVGGIVTYTSPELMPGGRFSQGDALLKIDNTTYVAALANARVKLANATLNQKLEQGRLDTAQREWTLMGGAGDSSELASRKLHMDVASADLSAAKAGVAMAKRDLTFTTIRAPFTGVLGSESVVVGQLISAGTSVATLVGDEALWVEVSVPVEQLSQLSLPGSAATATATLSNDTIITRTGTVLRAVGQLDPTTHSATVLVALEGSYSSDPPMLPGSLVVVTLTGDAVNDVILVPRTAFYPPDTLWTVEADQLVARTVDVLWGTADTIAVRGLGQSATIVTSPLHNPVAGTDVRVAVQ